MLVFHPYTVAFSGIVKPAVKSGVVCEFKNLMVRFNTVFGCESYGALRCGFLNRNPTVRFGAVSKARNPTVRFSQSGNLNVRFSESRSPTVLFRAFSQML